jgi:REP element-mobilizing transposase RayT
MARKLRIEFEGAIYHVLNRGNYRRDLFMNAGEAQAFVGALREAVKIYGWRLHAYAVMRNHYHLAVQTPQPNLKEGMHWLQSTFGTRFNRLHSERGHLFQGRYQALLVEDDAALTRLVNYIHLNPVRAGIVSPEQVAAFRWSSLVGYARGERFEGLTAEDWLRAMSLSDTPDGWASYLERLRQLALDPAEQERLGFGAMSRGWAIGTDAWKKAVAKDHAALAISPGLAAADVRALREAKWQECLDMTLATAGRTIEEMRGARRSAPWKVGLAVSIRDSCGASAAWLGEVMHLGKSDSVRSLLSRCRNGINQRFSA